MNKYFAIYAGLIMLVITLLVFSGGMLIGYVIGIFLVAAIIYPMVAYAVIVLLRKIFKDTDKDPSPIWISSLIGMILFCLYLISYEMNSYWLIFELLICFGTVFLTYYTALALRQSKHDKGLL